MLANKVVLITGAFSGIGQATTDLFMKSKCKVVAVGRNSHGNIPSYTGNYLPIVRNLRTEEDAREVIEYAIEKFDRIDVLLHCAGKLMLKPPHEHERADFERMLNDNFHTAVQITQLTLPHLLQRNEGTIIFFPGIKGRGYMPGTLAYSAAKHALEGYATALREELAHTRIRCTTIFLEHVDSEHWHDVEHGFDPQHMIHTQDAARTVWIAVQQAESAALTEFVVRSANSPHQHDIPSAYRYSAPEGSGATHANGSHDSHGNRNPHVNGSGNGSGNGHDPESVIGHGNGTGKKPGRRDTPRVKGNGRAPLGKKRSDPAS